MTEYGEVGTVDFDSEEDAALLKCVELDNEAESLLEKMGGGSKPIFMSRTMISYLINFPLAERMRRLKLSVKKIFTIEDQVKPSRHQLGRLDVQEPVDAG